MKEMSDRRTTYLRTGRKPIEITVARELEVPRTRLFKFLAEPVNHHRLASDKLRLLEVSEKRGGQIAGVIMIRGPFGLRRRARISTSTWQPLACIGGTAELGRRTTVDVAWHLLPTIKGPTKVVLRATVVQAGALDRLLLALGGVAWTRWLFNETLEILAAQTESFAPGMKSESQGQLGPSSGIAQVTTPDLIA